MENHSGIVANLITLLAKLIFPSSFIGNMQLTVVGLSRITHKKIDPWGGVYSLGCTKDQQEEDRKIIEVTCSPSTWNPKATTNAATPQDYGATNGVP
jgi:hypothetical protein